MIDDIEIIDILVVLMLVTHTWCCGQTDRQTDRQRGRQTDRHTEKQIDRDRQTDRQTR